MRSIRSKRVALGVLVGAIAALLPFGARQATAATALFDFPCSSAGIATGDFDNNGVDDLAVGAPGDDLEQVEVDGTITKGVGETGSINVTYSTAGADGGLDPAYSPSAATRKFFAQNTPGIQGLSEKDDRFGFALTAGNFDGVGGDDLAIGVPGEDGTGAIQILYSGKRVQPTSPTNFQTEGLAVGLAGSAAFNRFITQDSTAVDGEAEAGDSFGYALASFDLNGDNIDDLVIGAPREDVGTRKDAGVIQVIYGTAHGLDANGPTAGGVLADQVFEQGPGQIKNPEIGRTEAGDFFGASLTLGQFNDNNNVDIAIGSPGEDIGAAPDAGAVSILYSRGALGISRTNTDFFHQGVADLEGAPESGDRFGCSLAAGNFDADFDGDLAIGVPGEGIGSEGTAGAVQAIYNSGRSTGLSVDDSTVPPALTFWTEDQVWTEDEGGIPGVTKPGDRFGASLVAADFNGDNVGDLAIGLPTEQLWDHKQSGSVRVIYGFAGAGLTDDQPSAFGQSPTDVPSTCLLYGITSDLGLPDCLLINALGGSNDFSPLLLVEEENDHFGASLAAGDFNKDGKDDLSIGSPGEDLGAFVNWLTEEEVELPDELLESLGIPVSLNVDEATDAGAINIVYGPFPTPVDPPAKQDLLYRTGSSPFGSLRGVLHSALGDVILEDNQIDSTPADPSFGTVLEGDGFGTSQG